MLLERRGCRLRYRRRARAGSPSGAA